MASKVMVTEKVMGARRMPSMTCVSARHVRVEVQGASIWAITCPPYENRPGATIRWPGVFG